MNKLKKLIIYVEGKDDLSFFAEYIKASFPNSGIVMQSNTSYSFAKDKFEKDSQLLEYGGDKFIFEIPQIKAWKNDGYSIIVIADCDKSRADKEAHYNRIKVDNDIEDKDKDKTFELYLLGDNNGKGALERIMLECIKDRFKALSECFKEFNACLKSKGKDYKEYVVPHPFNNVKTYFAKFKEIATKGNKNPKIFNFKHPSLDTLKVFLKPYFE